MHGAPSIDDGIYEISNQVGVSCNKISTSEVYCTDKMNSPITWDNDIHGEILHFAGYRFIINIGWTHIILVSRDEGFDVEGYAYFLDSRSIHMVLGDERAIDIFCICSLENTHSMPFKVFWACDFGVPLRKKYGRAYVTYRTDNNEIRPLLVCNQHRICRRITKVRGLIFH